MTDEEIDLERKVKKDSNKLNKHQDEIDKQIDTMLAFGSLNLGLNNLNDDDYSDKRIKEDLKK
ncbi:hypothetical protein CLORY_32430 [Clostridium oryzae]|uniref:Uncharacterized protein n=2 Tax=Clostridium oryzae TaxID=1450648 RepID=A0A1V4IIR4_9CLOT|nr:hypothetical protein CLORY_32430 [Clostridium oryzae]